MLISKSAEFLPIFAQKARIFANFPRFVVTFTQFPPSNIHETRKREFPSTNKGSREGPPQL